MALMRQRLWFLLAGICWSAVGAAQPALRVGSDDVRPGDAGFVSLDYFGAGSGVERFTIQLTFQADDFASIRVFCPALLSGVAIRCTSPAPGRIELRALSSGGEIPNLGLGRITFVVADTVLPDPQVPKTISIESEDYRDAAGTRVSPLGSVPGELLVAQPEVPDAMSLAPGGRGTALIFPFFTARGERETRLLVRNGSPFPKAVRLNLREGHNGQLLLAETVPGAGPATALNLYIDPGAATVVRIFSDPATGEPRIQAGGCTFPEVPAGGLPLSPANLGNDPVGVPPADRLEEGFVTALAMADLVGGARLDLAAGDCRSIRNRWGSAGEWAIDPRTNTAPPVGPLEGAFSLRGLRGRVSYDDAPVVLQGFPAYEDAASGGNGHRGPWQAYDLSDGRSRAARFGAELDFDTSAEAVSALLLKDGDLLRMRGGGIEWILTAPTKWMFTDTARAVPGTSLGPFNSFLGASGACDPARLFPQGASVDRDLCWNANVVPFDGRALLESPLATPDVASIAGPLARISYSGTGLSAADSTVLSGLPVIGLAIPYRPDRTPRQRQLPIGALLQAPPNRAKGDGEGAAAGASVSVDGRLVFVGVPGANGGRGLVLVFRRHGTVLVPEATLEADPQYQVSGFGAALDSDGAQVVIGAPGDPGAGGKGPAQTLQAALWQRLNGLWSEKTPVLSDSGNASAAGSAVALEGDTFAVGAPLDDTMGAGAGAVLLFDGGLARQVLPQTPQQMGSFGASVDIKNGAMAIGAPSAQVAASFSGSVSMYGQIATNLTSLGSVTASSPADGDGFGTAVSLSGAVLAVGAPGVDGGTAQDPVPDQGQVQLYDFDGTNLVANLALVDQDAGASGQFGRSVVVTATGVLAGAPGVLGGSGATGAVYEYTVQGGEALLDARISPEEEDVSGYGSSLATDGEVVLIGAPTTAAEAGAALVVIDAEVLFFDDYETELLR